jgi:shikimate kinase
MQADRANSTGPLRIVLVGFMGAGKSTTGPILAQSLGWDFFDADRYLEQKCGLTVSAIFAELGESRFREMETEAIAELHAGSNLVLALGGGAVESEATRRLLASPSTAVVFLKAPFDVLIERCEQQPGAAVRPLLQQREALLARFSARLKHYEQAHLTVDTTDLGSEAVASRIVHLLQELYPSISIIQKAIAN